MPLAFTGTVHPLDFANLSGKEFERLVFATLVRMRYWDELAWNGQVGQDGGRDIIGVYEDEWCQPATVVVACANWQSLTLKKATTDIDALCKASKNLPRSAIVVTASSVSSDMRASIVAHGKAKKIASCEVWSGTEFEEKLRFHAPSVLERFFGGNPLPDEHRALREFVANLDAKPGREQGELLARVFKRPAFFTPIRQEGSLPAFRQAIANTIEALNTGIWRARDGAIIERCPSRNTIANADALRCLAACVQALMRLRVEFDDGLRLGEIRHLGGADPESPMFYIELARVGALERARDEALAQARDALKALGADPSHISP